MTLHEKIAQARLLADESAILKWITEASLSSSREMNFSEIEAHSIASNVRMGAVLALDKPCKVIPALAEALAIAVGHVQKQKCDCEYMGGPVIMCARCEVLFGIEDILGVDRK